MFFYLRTSIPANYLSKYINRYIKMYLPKIVNTTFNEYLVKNYGTNIYTVFEYLIKWSKASNVQPNLVQFYFDNNVYLGNTKLKNIIEFLEYGNLEIQSPKIITKIFNSAVGKLKDRLGGV